MDKRELENWFGATNQLLEPAYIAGELPWQQSGFGLQSGRTYEEWEAFRKPIADAINMSGSFLDIGCANGFLLECVVRWTGERGLLVDPYGLDLSEPLVALAKKRLPDHTHHLFVGNAWTWTPPQAFDFVRTELVYVPNDLHRDYVKRILDQYLRPGGTLIAAEYLNKTNSSTTLGIDRYLSDLGFMVEDVKLGLRDGVEGARIAVVKSSWG